MYCSKCGTENIDNAMFCKNCGASLYVQQQTQAEKEFYKSPETPKEEVKFESTENTENTVKGLIKKHASSQSFYVATILLTVALGLSVIGLGNALTISGVIALIAVWKIRNASKKDADFKSGVNLLKTSSIIGIITSVVVFGLGGIILVIMGAYVTYFANTFVIQWEEIIRTLEEALATSIDLSAFGFDIAEFLTTTYISMMFTILGIVFIFCFIVTMIFNIIALKNISAIKDMAETNVVKKNVSEGFIIFLYIIGGLNAASLLSGDVAAGVLGVSYILYANALSKFKQEVENVKDTVVDYQ